VDAWAAVVIGAVGGAIVVGSVKLLDRVKVDDPVGAISVHGVAGTWGTLSIGLFATLDDGFLGRTDAGLFYGGGIDQLVTQVVFVVVHALWVIPAAGLLFLAIKKTVGLRVSEEEELAGLDVMEHGASGYAEDVVAGVPSTGEGAPASRPAPVG
jgi:ammonium transporter, Amt family